MLACAGLLAAARIPAADLFSINALTNRVRVVIVENPQATEAFEPRAEVVQAMVDRAITALTGRTNVEAAWLSIVSTQDVVGIKVFSAPGAMAGTRPAVVAAVAQGLLAARVPASHIIIWDRRLVDLRLAGYGEIAGRLGVRLAGGMDSGYDNKIFYESSLLGNLLSGDLEFGASELVGGRKSHVSKLVSRELTKIISISPLLNNYEAGVAGNLFSIALGSVDNTRRFEADADSLARAVPEIYALPALGDRVVLNITDALLCQFEGGGHVRLHNAAVLNELRFSLDPVALDVLSVEELVKQRQLAGVSTVQTNSFDLFRNAALLELGISDPKKIQVEHIR